MTLSRRVVAEGLGTAFLLAAVVGSGIIGGEVGEWKHGHCPTCEYSGHRIVTQLLGAFAATVLFRWLLPSLASEAKEVVFPQVPTLVRDR
jgi:glycerol uptake facilitator-like aquaporin